MAEPSTPGVRYPIVNGSSSRSESYKTTQTATGQSLTHYHSLLYSLLSWERPRATAISFASVAAFILAARFLPLLRWALKFLYLSLGLTAAIEIIGKILLSQGLTSSLRPRKYYTIPKETIEGVLEDLEQLVDFFLIEFQRILFAENLVHTIAAFSATFLFYWLSKILPLWALSLIAVTVAYLGPLVYIANQEIINEQIENAQQIINSQANHVKDLAGQQTAHATGLMKQYVGDYGAKALGRSRSASPEILKPTYIKAEPSSPESNVNQIDFPAAPKDEPTYEEPVPEESTPETKQEPILA